MLRPQLRRRSFLSLPLLVLLILAAARTDAATILVPTDVPTIQGAIDAAVAGDIVEIAAGTYFENVTTLGKAITVRGAGIGMTIIDGSALTAGAENGSVVRIENGEDANTVLEHLTLTGGIGSERVEVTNTVAFGGGLYVFGAEPTVRFVECVGNTDVNRGSGAFFEVPGLTPYTIRDCIFRENFDGSGCGLTVHSTGTVVIEDCDFLDNTSGIDGAGALFRVNDLTIRGCRFEGNITTQGFSIGAGFVNLGVGAEPRVVLVENTVVRSNTCNGPGGGIVALGEELTVRDCIIAGNSSSTGPAVTSDGADTIIERTIIHSNDSPDGSTIALSVNGGSLFIDRSTIDEDSVGAIVTTVGLTPTTIRNSVIWGSGPGVVPVAPAFINPPIVEYSTIEGGYVGTGNLALDPLFTDPAAGDFSLLPGSPAIDAGDPTAPFDPDGSIIEQGAVPFVGIEFRRGDVNLDGVIDVADPIAVFGAFFFGGAPLPCDSATDANDDEQIDLADPIYTLNFLFQGGPLPPPPVDCGVDPTPGTSCDEVGDGCA